METYNIYLSTDAGKVRTQNEDNFVVNEITRDITRNSRHIKGEAVQAPLLCGVFDGMGGENGGAEASKIAAAVAAEFYRFLRDGNQTIEKRIGDYAENSTKLIREYLDANRMKRGGTTFVMAYLTAGRAHLFSMGDSRIYLYHEGILRRISRDDTLAQKKYEANIFTAAEAVTSNESHVLTRYLGMDAASAEFRVHAYVPVVLAARDRLLLCSDGLYDMCTEDEIAAVLAQDDAPYSIELTNAALKKGGEDNITCMVIVPAGKR
ncbi:MAG: serine/threonine-protein phosphatase [Ruminococcus sp.]|nr:serine/threonine-protein phosphatase [Ruminococcus sp.]